MVPKRTRRRIGGAMALLSTIVLFGLAQLGVRAIDPARPGLVPTPDCYARGATWQDTMLATRARLLAGGGTDSEIAAVWARLDRDFPVPSDWMLQDLGTRRDDWFSTSPPSDLMRSAIARVSSELGAGARVRSRADSLVRAQVSPTDRRWLDLYVTACEARRAKRLTNLLRRAPCIVFAMHFNMGGSHYAYTEGQSDAQDERHFYPGAALCRLDMAGINGRVTTLIDEPRGVIRDPNVSWDGRTVVFAWKKSDREDDYHLYDLETTTGRVRQLTAGLGVADYEPAYLANGDLVFSSTRCIQTVDCWWTEVSNLFTCDRNGAGIRRLGFDQVHTNYPQVMDDGTVTYTRWEYNDRGQIFVQGLFQMNPDGTGQTEYYGNNSWFPTALLHARGIPGTGKVVAVASGHHSSQAGKLCIVDPSRGRQENEGVRLVAPRTDPAADRIDSYGQEGDQWMNPWPLSEREYLVSFWPDDGHRAGRDRFDGWYSIYWMDADGRRELLASDPERSCHNPVPLTARPRPRLRPSAVDNHRETGSFYVQDVYQGPGLAGIARGTAKKLRVVALDYRAAGVRANGNAGPAGGALVSTPIGVSNAAWDPKTVLGEATIHPDGSAYFEAPARTPVYFQVLDGKGRAIQTMRSWSALQPGERFACTGCHEPKKTAPGAARPSMALKAGLEKLARGPGPGQGFSFRREIQPILDRACVGCHSNRSMPPPGQGAALTADLAAGIELSPREAEWSHTTVDPGPGWDKPDFDATTWRKGRAGFGNTGGAMATPWETTDIWLRRTFVTAAVPAGFMLVAEVFHDEDVEISLNGIPAAEQAGFLTAFAQLRVREAAAAAVRPGPNVLAAHCRQTAGGQGIEVALYAVPKPADRPAGAFSLLGQTRIDAAAGRRWSDAYLALTASAPDPRNPEVGGAWTAQCTALVNWVHPQSTPPLQTPASTGAIRSRLLDMLETGHHGVRLTADDLRRIACWIDLGVPFCGDYVEANAWSDAETDKYLRFQAKRMRMEELERRGRRPVPTGGPVGIEFVGSSDAGLVRASGIGVLEIEREFRPGDRLLLVGPSEVGLRIDDQPAMRLRAVDGIHEFGLHSPGRAEVAPGKRHRISAAAVPR